MCAAHQHISIHALLAESDIYGKLSAMHHGYFYPRSPCGERLPKQAARQIGQAISIHALLAESDNAAGGFFDSMWISIHALLAESDFDGREPSGEFLVFLSTLSLRRATPVRDVIQWEGIFLSTLSLRRATTSTDHHPTSIFISIHALLAESDGGPSGQNAVILHFYPRSPCGERRKSFRARRYPAISIHALLAESDIDKLHDVARPKKFLSTLSLRRATHQLCEGNQQPDDFYPRSPCGERRWPRGMIPLSLYFYPRSPCGERLRLHFAVVKRKKFLSTLSLRRATCWVR